MNRDLTEEELNEIEKRCNAATEGPWESFIEGRDHESGSDFIRTGRLDDNSPDIELMGTSREDQDFIAHARQAVPRLLEEVRKLRKQLNEK